MSSVHQRVPQLRRRRLGVIHLVFFTVAASAPLTVLGGGVTTTFAVSGIAGVPLSFIVLAVALALFVVGYAAMSRHVANAGAFYSYLAQGLGPRWAVSGSFVALITYITIGTGLYGLFGATVSQLMAGFGVIFPWWVWAVLLLAVVGLLGVLRVDLNASVLAVLLVIEILVVVLYDIGAFAHPAGGAVTLTGLKLSDLFVPGVGAVLAFSIAGFIGFESGAIYSEECRNPRVTVARATFVALAFTGLFYALSAWAMIVTVGADGIQAAATGQSAGLVFASLASNWSPALGDIAGVLFLTSVFAAILSFHNGVARYLFALGREEVLPRAFSRVGARSGGPVAGSITQSVISLIVIVVFALLALDPVAQLFTWFSGLAALGFVLLMAATSIAVIGYFRRRPGLASTWQRLIAPALAAVALLIILVLLVQNFDLLLGGDEGVARWLVPALVLLAAIAGMVWATVLQRARPVIYHRIGKTAMAPEVQEPRIELATPPT